MRLSTQSTSLRADSERSIDVNKIEISATDCEILNCIQEDIPLCSEPFKVLSERLGIEEENLLERIKALKEKGIIRRFAAGVNHKKLGFASSLIALRIPEENVEAVAGDIVKYKEVTHCYLREGEYNLWLVFISLEKIKLTNFLESVTKRFGKENVLNLSTRKQFKLRTNLHIVNLRGTV